MAGEVAHNDSIFCSKDRNQIIGWKVKVEHFLNNIYITYVLQCYFRTQHNVVKNQIYILNPGFVLY